MNATFTCAQILAIAAAVPTNTRDLSEYGGDWGQAEVNRIIAATGISKIREAQAGTTTADLCAAAAQQLFVEHGVNPQSVEGIVFVSQTGDHILPATSPILQHRLGLGTHVAAFDINYGCSGYIYGLLQAHLLIHSGMCKSVLVCAGDISTAFLSPRDRSVRMVFGDAGSATLVAAGEQQHTFTVKTDGSGAKSLIIPAGGSRQPRTAATGLVNDVEDGNARSAEHLYMDGMAVMNFALQTVPEVIDEVLALSGWDKKDLGFYGLHQANRFMIDYIRRKMKLPPAAVPFACSEIGNTGPASIPVLLAKEGKRLREEGRLERSVLCGFGVGLSTAAMTLGLGKTRILDLVEVG